METVISVQRDDFPRVYRVEANTRSGINMLLVVLAGVFLFVIVLGSAQFIRRGGSPGNLIFVSVAAAIIVTGLGSANNKRVLLHRDAIEVVGWFYRRKLSFAQIGGRQTTASSRLPFGYGYVFVPSQSSERKLVLPPFLQTDQNFRDWIKTIPTIPRREESGS